METKLTLKQRSFANGYLESGNATEAANRAYKPKNRNTAHAIGVENLRKPTIKAFLDEKARDAVLMVYKLSQRATSEAIRLNASRDILDRAGYFTDKTKVAEDSTKRVIAIHINQVIAEREGIEGSACSPDCPEYNK
jgi:phage terminase small subunit